MHVALPKQPINWFQLGQQSRQQALRAYCSNIYTVLIGLISYFGVSAAQEFAYGNDAFGGGLSLSANSGVDFG